MIIRTNYLDKLQLLKDKDLIKVVMGIRRCGKSTLLHQFREQLIVGGVSKEQIQFTNFEVPEENKPWREIYDNIVKSLVSDKMNYIFFDEVQVIKNFEKLVNGLYIRPNCDVYITGSNALLLSGELATFLSGRTFEIEMFPFSFAEYNSAFKDNKYIHERYNDYINYSSFPETIELFNSDAVLIDTYLSGIYNTVITKDILDRGKIRYRDSLEKVIEFIFDSIGSEVSPGNIAKQLSINGIDVDNKTVDNYIDVLSQSYILYPVSRFDIKGFKLLKTQKKYYVPDIGLSRAILKRGFNTDLGHILENVVYLELRRKGGRIAIGKIGEKEVDFVHILPGGEKVYYQVAYTAKETSTLERELAPFKRIRDNYDKFLITTDETERNLEGVRLINAYKWLLNEGSV
jgi:predicted AAA+ superfamily ATPase